MHNRRVELESHSRLTRRQLLRNAALGSFGLVAPFALRANPLGMPIGCQTYPVRKMIATDFPGTVKQLSQIGFQTIELCSPKGYAKAGFASVAQYKGAALPRLLSDFNLKCHSSHFSMRELRDDLPGSIAWAKDVGLTQMMVPSLDGPRNPTMDDVKRVAEEFNNMARQTAEAGIPLGLHNENFEVSKVDGKRTYDVLFSLLDPKLVKFQFQCSTISDGFVAADYFTRYPGRFISMHVQDWSAEERKQVPVGQGSIDWRKTFHAAKTEGIKNYFVEMDLDLMKASVPYLRKL
ncbi:MAG TPA: TIM barrel protein [Bryobacteraceae bacterium]|nr:TIM barrel protein [Bryobacteraceae bacterium]